MVFDKVRGEWYWNHCVHLAIFIYVWILCLDTISRTAQPFVSILDKVVYDHEPECQAGKLGCCLEGQGHRVGLGNQNMIVSTVPNLMVQHHMPEYAVKNLIAAFKVKVTKRFTKSAIVYLDDMF